MSHALILAPFAQKHIERIRQRVRVTHESWLETGRIFDPDELALRINEEKVGYLVVEADFVFSETLEQVATLELIGVCRNALNQVDVEDATRRGVLVVNAPGRNSVAVAELTIGLVLDLARGISRANGYVKSGRWSDPVGAYAAFRGSELAGKTAGIIGLGAIGRLVARRLQGLDMRVVAADPYVGPEQAAGIGVGLTDLDLLLANSDYVLVHAPALPATMGMIGQRQLGRMKPTAFLVNTSAAGVVDEQALIAALSTGRIAGAALDVFDGQPLPSSSKLLTLENVILTPHIGGATEETIERHSRMIADDILLLLDGHRPRNLVNAQAWERRIPSRKQEGG